MNRPPPRHRPPAPRVLLVAPWPPPEGGMAVQARGLAAALQAAGVPVVVVPTNVGLGPLARIRGLRGVVNLAVFLVRLVAGIPRADVIHILAASGLSFFLFTAPAVLLGRVAGRRVVVNYRGGLARSFLEKRRRLAVPILRRGHRLVVPSGYLEGVFTRFGLRPEVVPNFVDVARFQARIGPRRGARILVARSLEPLYNIEGAIDAFRLIRRRIPAAELVIAGTGRRRAALEARVRAGAIAGVTFLGRVEHDRIPALYAETDVALNPSHADNMPISILEAFASGTPVVSTRAGGVAHLVEDGRTGLLVPVGDTRGLAAAVLKLLRRPERGARLARAARSHVERFDLGRVASAWCAIYRAEAVALGRA